jgi:hypothetical protein
MGDDYTYIYEVETTQMAAVEVCFKAPSQNLLRTGKKKR